MNSGCLLAIGTLLLAASKVGATPSDIWEDFESYSNGGNLQTDTGGKWVTISNTGTRRIVADPLDAANQCLKIDTGSGSSNNGAYRSLGDRTIFSGEGFSIAVSFDIRTATSNNSANTSIGLATGSGTTWGDFAAYVILKDGGLSSRNGSTEMKIADNVGSGWLHIILVINPVSETYNVYLDGSLVAENFKFRTTGRSLTTLKVYGSSNGTDTAYLDNIGFLSHLLASPDTYRFPFGELATHEGSSVLENDVNATSAVLVTDIDTSGGASLTFRPDGTFTYTTPGTGTNAFWYSAANASETSPPTKVSLITNPDLSDAPNVLFIAIDDLNDVPTFMGRYPDAVTPNMDRLAASGVAFLNAHCTLPVCGPSRASFMSGLRPVTLGMAPAHPDISDVLSRVFELGGSTIDIAFKQAGYTVFSAGKVYHSGQNTWAPDMTGGNPAFGKEEGINFTSSRTLTDWGMPSYGSSDSNFSDKANAEFAMARLQETHEAPFLLMVGFVQPHVPWYTPQAYLDLYPNPESLTLHHYDPDDWNDIPQESRDRNYLNYMPNRDDMISRGQADDIIHHYLACTSFTDHYLGKVLDALEASPYGDNTIIVLLSDHGYHLGEKNTYQKHSLYERSSHVPLVIAGPGIAPSQNCTRVVSLLDIFPTLIDLAGLPDNPVMEGRSLTPLLDDPATEWDYPALISWRGGNYAVQTEQYRYFYYSHGAEELYDHSVDLNEITNLAYNPAYDSVKEDLKKHLPLNLLSPGFPVRIIPDDDDTPEDYLTYLLGKGDLRIYNHPVNSLSTVVEGMKIISDTSINYNDKISLNLEMVPVGPYGNYRAELFSPRDLRDLSISGSQADRDNDFQPLLVEYALGLDPGVPDSTKGLSIVNSTQPSLARIKFNRLPEHNDIDIRIKISTDLSTDQWITMAESLQGGPTTATNGASIVETGTAIKEVTVEYPLQTGETDDKFFRFEISL